MANEKSNPTRREVLVGAAAATAAALSGCGGEAPAPIPGPRATKRPNILFLFSDQHRPDWLGRTPSIPVPTPNMDRLAARGVDFAQTITPAPVCGPSRACLASGMEYENCGVAQNSVPFPLDRTTFYRLLRESGYHTMATGKIDLHKGAGGRSSDGRKFMEEWGFSDTVITGSKNGAPNDPYGVYLDSLDPPMRLIHSEDMARRKTPREENWWGMTEPTALSDEAYKDSYTVRTGLELLDRAPEGKPWFLFMNTNGPHPSMDITRRMEAEYRGPDRVIEDFPQPHNYAGLARGRSEGRLLAPQAPFTPERHIRIRQNYSAIVENIDRWLGICQERLEERGELDNTIVIYSSDHGEMLGDHDWWGKSFPFQMSAGVPLIMAGPGIAAGGRSDALVSLMDLSATCLDFAEVAVPEEMESRSLRGLLDAGEGEHRDYLRSALKTGYAESGRWRSVQDHRYKLIEGFFEERTLFDLEADPLENENIAAGKPGDVARLEKLFVSA